MYKTTSILLVFLLLWGCSSHEKTSLPRPVQAIQLKAADVAAKYTYAGIVNPRYETPLAFRVGGKVATRTVDVGQQVHPGQLLATLDNKDLKINVDNKEAAVAESNSKVSLTKTDLDRYTPLLPKGYVSASQYHQIKSNYETAVAEQTRANSDLTNAKQQLSYANLISDYEGIITQTLVNPGQVVTAGQTIMQIALAGEKEVVIDVPEQRVNDWRNSNYSLAVDLWAYPSDHYSAKVREISGNADPVTRTYKIKLSILNPNKDMQLGMTADVIFKRYYQKPEMTLPISAIFYEGKQAKVWVINRNEMTVIPVAVNLGDFSENNSIIILSGLQLGQWVVTAGVHNLNPGQKITLLQ